jgi:cysteine desulfuration protein SufE
MFDGLTDEDERMAVLLSYADRFRTVPGEIATRPYPEANRVPYCESDAYVWVLRGRGDTVDLQFAVENPSGVSARALASILQETLSGRRAADVARVSPDIVPRIFRRNISMGKGIGLTAMVQAVQTLARRMALAS